MGRILSRPSVFVQWELNRLVISGSHVYICVCVCLQVVWFVVLEIKKQTRVAVGADDNVLSIEFGPPVQAPRPNQMCVCVCMCVRFVLFRPNPGKVRVSQLVGFDVHERHDNLHNTEALRD